MVNFQRTLIRLRCRRVADKIPPDLPEGFNPSQVLQDGQRPQRPEGMTPPEGMERPDAGTITETGEPRTDFYMQDKVNAFSGVADAE